MPSTIAHAIGYALLGPYDLPPKKPTGDVTIPRAEWEALKRKLARLEQSSYEESWRTNPDRMGS